MNINELKNTFKNGKIPFGEDFSNLINHCFNYPGSSNNKFISGKNINVNTISGLTYIDNTIKNLSLLDNIIIDDNNENNNLLFYNNESYINNDYDNTYYFEYDLNNPLNYLIINNLLPIKIKKISLFTDSGNINMSLLINDDEYVDKIVNLEINTEKLIYKPTNSFLSINDDLKINVNKNNNANKLYCAIQYQISNKENYNIKIKIKENKSTINVRSSSNFTIKQDNQLFNYNPGIDITVNNLNSESYIYIYINNTTSTDYFKFNNFPNDINVEYCEILNMGQITDWSKMFKDLIYLKKIDINYNITKNVTNLEQTWENNKLLTEFPIINTSNVTNMKYTWYNCEKLLNFPKLDTSNVTTLSLTWFDCKLLTTFPEINTSNVTDVYSTWGSCVSLKCINGTLDFTNVISKSDTFNNCNNLIYPSISGTTIRNGENALNGLWVNPNDC